jgi:hypothetical protein
MVQHVERRLGLLSGLAVAVLLACAPASAKAPPADAGTSSGKDGGTSAKAAPAPEQKSDGATAKASGGGSCSGKATFCGVYGQTFCSSQPGCSYSFATSTCGGLPIKCEKATNETFCKKIKGCTWQ